MSKVRADTIAKSDNSASVPVDTVINGSAKAWVNFNGTNGVIRAGFNIASVTRVALCRYTVNFLTPMPDTNYCPFITIDSAGTAFGQPNRQFAMLRAMQTTGFSFETIDDGGAQTVDSTVITVVVFR